MGNDSLTMKSVSLRLTEIMFDSKTFMIGCFNGIAYSELGYKLSHTVSYGM